MLWIRINDELRVLIECRLSKTNYTIRSSTEKKTLNGRDAYVTIYYIENVFVLCFLEFRIRNLERSSVCICVFGSPAFTSHFLNL